jgi:hypothetical protein
MSIGEHCILAPVAEGGGPVPNCGR